MWQDLESFWESFKWFLCYTNASKTDKASEQQFLHQSETNILELFAAASSTIFDAKTTRNVPEGQSQLLFSIRSKFKN